MSLLAVGVAGALGALLRHAVVLLTGPTGWPWATLGVNVVGSFLLGLTTSWGAARFPAVVTLAVGTGFLGAFTTYSTFSVQTVALVRDGRSLAAAAYVGASLALGLAAAAAGLAVGRGLLGGAGPS